MLKKKNTRLPAYDYSTNGYYFITNNTDFSKPVVVGKLKELIKHELFELEKRYAGVSIFYYSLMPTHAHIIVGLENCSTSIPEIWRVFKSITTVKAKQKGLLSGVLWQRNYYEHVIRTEKALDTIVNYIANNPFKENVPMSEIYGDRIPNISIS